MLDDMPGRPVGFERFARLGSPHFVSIGFVQAREGPKSPMWFFKWWLAWQARRGTRSLNVAGRLRSYCVHVPPGHDPGTPAAVVIVLHGATMTGPLMAWFTGLAQKADQAGFLAVYPDGTGRRFSYFWNAGQCCGPAARDRVDDVAFIRAVLDDLAATYRVDPRRIFAAGLSNGAMMAYRLAAEMSDRIAAVACVGGTMAIDECRPSRPVPVLHIHGTDDEFVPFAGGVGPKSITGVRHRSVESTIDAWVRADRCETPPTVDVLPDRTRDGTRVTRTSYRGGPNGADVVLVVVEHGGHTWPGRDIGSNILGKSTRNASANDLIWEFFERHPKP